MRRHYIDCARGIAVLLMIEAHTTDAWTHAASKSSVAFRNATLLGGFAAPLFLWLAGLSVVLSATRAAERAAPRAAAAAVCRRGLEIFLLAFLFRLQAFIVSPGSPPIALFRVDILNIMGPAMAMAAVMWALGPATPARVAIFAVAAVVTAMMAPLVGVALWVDALPQWIQWYVRPAGEHTTFTAFPWIGFVFAGAAVGALLVVAQDDRTERRIHVAVALAGAALVAAGLSLTSRQTIHETSAFWTSSPAWFSIRTGVLMIALPAVFWVGLVRGSGPCRWQQRLATLGRNSLFVYWIHVELVYGYASWLWRGRLPLWGTAVGALLFAALMYGAIVVRDWAVEGGHMRRPAFGLFTLTFSVFSSGRRFFSDRLEVTEQTRAHRG
jgi:uncharacterized membrane protein